MKKLLLMLSALALTGCGQVIEEKYDLFFGTVQNSASGVTTTVDVSFESNSVDIERGYVRGGIRPVTGYDSQHGSYQIINYNQAASSFDLQSETWDYNDITSMSVQVSAQSIQGIIKAVQTTETIFVNLEPITETDGTVVFLGSLRSVSQGELPFELSVSPSGVISGHLQYFGNLILSGGVLPAMLETANAQGVDFGGLPNSVMVMILLQASVHQVADRIL